MILALVGCGGAPPSAVVAPVRAEPQLETRAAAPPVAENAAGIEIAEPEPGSSPRAPQRDSMLRLGVRIPLAPVAARANEATPQLLAEQTWGAAWIPLRIGYRVTRGTIALRGAGDAIDWSVPVHLSGTADIIGSCEAELTARVSTRLAVSNDWRLRAISEPGALEWQRPCEVFFGLVDMTSTIEPRVLAAQDEMARTIDERLASESLADSLGALWTGLSRRIPLEEGFGLWLRPTRIGVSEIRSSPDALETIVEIGVRPIAATQAPGDAALRPLPRRSSVSSSEREFTLHADVEVPLSRVAAEVETTARPQIAAFGGELASVRSIGGRDAIWFGFELARPVRMTAWFGAEVGFDPSTRALTVSRVQASDDTRATLARLGIDASLVENAFGAGLSFPVADRIEAIERQYRTVVATPFRFEDRAELRIRAGEISLAGTFHTPASIGVVLAIGGSADLVVLAP